MKPFVTFDEAGEFQCSCGNYPNAEGAYPSDANGDALGDCKIITMFCCDRCGVVFDANTGDVVGQRKEKHQTDSDCAGHVDSTTNLCSVCGVLHGDPCVDCGGRGFHNETCILNRIKLVLDRFPLAEDEPIDGCDAVDALVEIKQLIDTNKESVRYCDCDANGGDEHERISTCHD